MNSCAIISRSLSLTLSKNWHPTKNAIKNYTNKKERNKFKRAHSVYVRQLTKRTARGSNQTDLLNDFKGDFKREFSVQGSNTKFSTRIVCARLFSSARTSRILVWGVQFAPVFSFSNSFILRFHSDSRLMLKQRAYNAKFKKKKSATKKKVNLISIGIQIKVRRREKKEQIPIEKEIDSKWISNIGNNNKNQIVD